MSTHMKNKIANAALTVLSVLQLVMLAALFSGTAPHPPQSIPPFAMGPFLGASIAIAIAALVLEANSNGLARTLSIAACLLALVSFGPQKWFDPVFSEVWPTVLLAQVAACTLLWSCIGLQTKSDNLGK